MKKMILVLVASSGVMLAACSGSQPPATSPQTQSTTQQTQSSPSVYGDQTVAKTVTVTGNNFSFDPKEIKVNKGDTVKIVFKNAEGHHDLHIDEFNAATKVINAGEEDSITFVADKTGTFQYYCAVGQHRAMGMWGNLIVQ